MRRDRVSITMFEGWGTCRQMSGGRLITCDLICAGVPSPQVFQDFLRFLEGKNGKTLASYCHRGKHVPWGSYEEYAVFDDGSICCGSAEIRVWSRIWSRFLLRPSCHKCPYHSVDRPGDLTIGDYWGLETVFPELVDDLGVSCVFASTSQGLELLKDARKHFCIVESSVAECLNDQQPRLASSLPADPLEGAFWNEYYQRGFDAAIKRVGAYGIEQKIKAIVKPAPTLDFNRASNGDACPPCEWDGDVSSIPAVFAVKNRSDEDRRSSSSGGVFIGLAQHIVELGGIVYACHTTSTHSAELMRCATVEECKECMGSKYQQSNMKNAYVLLENDLRSEKNVLFFGTPCQVAAVKKYCEMKGIGNATAE